MKQGEEKKKKAYTEQRFHSSFWHALVALDVEPQLVSLS